MGRTKMSPPPQLSDATAGPPNEASIDALDRKIIEALQTDCQLSNKELAHRFRVAESTIAGRIRAMREKSVMKVIAQRDVRSLGYEFFCLADIHVAGRSVKNVAADLAKVDEITSVALLLGSPAIIVQVNGRDRKHLLQVLEQKVGSVQGITTIETTLALEIVKFDSEYGELYTQ